MLKVYFSFLYCKNQVPSPNIYIRIMLFTANRLRLKCDGTRRRKGGEVMGKQENGVGNH
jgi:hypothetical protein